jgi:hypothetical protein
MSFASFDYEIERRKMTPKQREEENSCLEKRAAEEEILFNFKAKKERNEGIKALIVIIVIVYIVFKYFDNKKQNEAFYERYIIERTENGIIIGDKATGTACYSYESPDGKETVRRCITK